MPFVVVRVDIVYHQVDSHFVGTYHHNNLVNLNYEVSLSTVVTFQCFLQARM